MVALVSGRQLPGRRHSRIDVEIASLRSDDEVSLHADCLIMASTPPAPATVRCSTAARMSAVMRSNSMA
jgi:hypothetical protein